MEALGWTFPISPARRFIGTSRLASGPLMEPMVALSVSSMLFARILVAMQPQGSWPCSLTLKAQRGGEHCRYTGEESCVKAALGLSLDREVR